MDEEWRDRNKCENVFWKPQFGWRIVKPWFLKSPPFLLLFLETKAHFEMLYLLKQLVTLLQFVTPLVEIWFCCQSCDVIFPPKTVNIEKRIHTIVWNTKFYHPGNIELKRIKTAKVVPKWSLLASWKRTRTFTYASTTIALGATLRKR